MVSWPVKMWLSRREKCGMTLKKFFSLFTRFEKMCGKSTGSSIPQIIVGLMQFVESAHFHYYKVFSNLMHYFLTNEQDPCLSNFSFRLPVLFCNNRRLSRLVCPSKLNKISFL